MNKLIFSIGGIFILGFLLLPLLILSCSTPSEPAPMPHENVVHPPAVAGDPYDLSYLKDKNPADVDNSNLPITPVDRLSLTGRPPKSVDIDSYRLTISGRVASTLDLNYRELCALPSVTEVVLLICHGSHVDNARWTGVLLSTLLEKAGAPQGEGEATFIALDRYSRTLSLDMLKSSNAFIAYRVNGEEVPLKHGYPARLVIKGIYGENWVKWLRQIEIK